MWTNPVKITAKMRWIVIDSSYSPNNNNGDFSDLPDLNLLRSNISSTHILYANWQRSDIRCIRL